MVEDSAPIETTAVATSQSTDSYPEDTAIEKVGAASSDEQKHAGVGADFAAVEPVNAIKADVKSDIRDDASAATPVTVEVGLAAEPEPPAEAEEPSTMTSEATPGSIHTHELQSAGNASVSGPTKDEEDEDFVPADMEHIVGTGATQDATSSMSALRELVAQARASSGQAREALPPGFADEEWTGPLPTSTQRGEKRKAEAELEHLVQASVGIEEVKAAAEKSQHPETRTLLQKALSSISGLVSRRPKLDPSTSSTVAEVTDQVKKTGEDGDADTESSSDSESSSDDSSDDEDDEDDDGEDDARNAGMALGADDDDEEGGGPSGSTAPATKNEILAPEVEKPLVQQLSDAERATLRKLGKVHSIVDSVVVLEQDVQQSKSSDASNLNSVPVDSTGRQGERHGEYSVLDTGSLLCFEDGKVLGLVFETFGSIHNPMYSIRFPSASAIDRDAFKTGRPVYYLPAQSTYVLTQLLRSMKGSDASNMWDEEVAEDEIDYSDDEQEAEAKRRAKAVRTGKVDDQGNPLPSASNRANKRQRHGVDSSHSAASHPQSAHAQKGAGPRKPITGPNGDQQRTHSSTNSHLRRNNGPAPPSNAFTPASVASLGPAFPHGVASLPPRPSAGLPSKPNFASEPSSSSAARNGDATPDSASLPRSRIGTAEGVPVGLSHSRMSSGAGVNLPAKPVDAAAAAAAAHRPQAAGVMGSPQQPPRLASKGPTAPMPVSNSGHPNQASPGWYSGSGSATPNTPASPAMASPHAAGRGAAYSPGSGAAQPSQPSHYNPAYAQHWQHGYTPASSSGGPPQRPQGAMPWNVPQAYPAPPLHLGQGSFQPQAYPSYGGSYGHYGAPAAGQWNEHHYPGSHYPGYTDGANGAAMPSGVPLQQGHAGQAYGMSAYSSPTGGGGAYSVYGYGTSAQPPPRAAGADSYDPRSPSMTSNGHSSSTQQGGQQGQ